MLFGLRHLGLCDQLVNNMRDIGVDGFGMTIKEVVAHIIAGRLRDPPLGVYRDQATYDEFRVELKRATDELHNR